MNIKRFLQNNGWAIALMLSLCLCTTDALADEVFGALKDAGKSMFAGLRQVIYPASTIGVACVCIAGMFGNFNWKWLAAILIGIFVITYAAETGKLAGADMAGGS